MIRRLHIIFILIAITALAPSVYSQETPEMKLSSEPVRLQPGEEGALSVTYTIPEGTYLAKQEQFFYFEAELPEGVSAGPVRYPEGKEKNGLTVYRESVTLTRTITVSDGVEPGRYNVEINAGYQFCAEDGTCYLPQKKNLSTELTIVAGDEAGTTIGEEATPVGLTPLRVLQYLIMAFIGGVLLNVMPCVLPLLSVRALSLVNQSGQDRRKIFFNSLIYTGGILFSFLVIAGVVVGLKLSGELVGWGFQFQNPTFVLVLASIIFVFALAMFDVFVITAPGMNVAAKASSKSGYIGSFLTGVFAVLVATPCTAPFLGAALGFAFTQPPLMILSILMLVGLGLSLPFILLGLKPTLIQRIPKPGEWMNIFKEVMGFLLIGTVIYMLNTLYHQIGGENLVRVIVFLAILGFGAWLYGRFAKPGTTKKSQWITTGVIVAIVVGSSIFVPRFDSAETSEPTRSTARTDEEGRIPFSPETVEELRERQVPVFVTFHAEWCTTCKVNEAAVLSSEEIRNAFDEYGVRVVSGDFTSRDKTIAEWIRRFGKAGVPVNVLYVPGKEKPILFSEILTKKMILDALHNHMYNTVQED